MATPTQLPPFQNLARSTFVTKSSVNYGNATASSSMILEPPPLLCPFLNLPPEIRRQIYAYDLCPARIMARPVGRGWKSKHHVALLYFDANMAVLPFSPQRFDISKVVRSELYDLFRSTVWDLGRDGASHEMLTGELIPLGLRRRIELLAWDPGSLWGYTADDMVDLNGVGALTALRRLYLALPEAPSVGDDGVVRGWSADDQKKTCDEVAGLADRLACQGRFEVVLSIGVGRMAEMLLVALRRWKELEVRWVSLGRKRYVGEVGEIVVVTTFGGGGAGKPLPKPPRPPSR